jgi:hypothetical protein
MISGSIVARSPNAQVSLINLHPITVHSRQLAFPNLHATWKAHRVGVLVQLANRELAPLRLVNIILGVSSRIHLVTKSTQSAAICAFTSARRSASPPNHSGKECVWRPYERTSAQTGPRTAPSGRRKVRMKEEQLTCLQFTLDAQARPGSITKRYLVLYVRISRNEVQKYQRKLMSSHVGTSAMVSKLAIQPRRATRKIFKSIARPSSR